MKERANERKQRSHNNQSAPQTTPYERPSIERYSSPKTKHTDENTPLVFSSALFVVVFLVVCGAGYAFVGGINIWIICLALLIAVLMLFTIRVAPEWERVVILRFGNYRTTAGPGLYYTIPFVDHIALHADLRIMLTGFGAEETLTADLVPINVDAAVFWNVWDPKKACLEVEDYYDSVAIAAQTALRDAIGRRNVADVAMRRVQLDNELKCAIEDKTGAWGVSILSVEIRDVVIPKELQESMSAEARAERERDARVVLAEVEQDIAAMLHEAAEVYREDDIAFRLRSMHLLNEGIKEAGGTMVVPSAYVDGFTPDSLFRPR
jgi:regulator of protease activity HflC (stomatin/prohibitin superfamily)